MAASSSEDLLAKLVCDSEALGRHLTLGIEKEWCRFLTQFAGLIHVVFLPSRRDPIRRILKFYKEIHASKLSTVVLEVNSELTRLPALEAGALWTVFHLRSFRGSPKSSSMFEKYMETIVAQAGAQIAKEMPWLRKLRRSHPRSPAERHFNESIRRDIRSGIEVFGKFLLSMIVDVKWDQKGMCCAEGSKPCYSVTLFPFRPFVRQISKGCSSCSEGGYPFACKTTLGKGRKRRALSEEEYQGKGESKRQKSLGSQPSLREKVKRSSLELCVLQHVLRKHGID